jgi:hypothetical protein
LFLKLLCLSKSLPVILCMLFYFIYLFILFYYIYIYFLRLVTLGVHGWYIECILLGNYRLGGATELSNSLGCCSTTSFRLLYEEAQAGAYVSIRVGSASSGEFKLAPRFSLFLSLCLRPPAIFDFGEGTRSPKLVSAWYHSV